MALEFPLYLTQFFDLLPIASRVFEISGGVDVAETADGEILSSDTGSALWSGSFDLDTLTPDEASDVLPLVQLLRRSGTSFLVGDPMRQFPRLDPQGLILGASTPTIHAIAVTMRELSIAGLPSGYQISRGDLLSFVYLSGPTRYALHECLTDVTVPVGGVSPLIEVSPPIRAGAVPGTEVRLSRTRCKARLIPADTTLGAAQASIYPGARIAWRQSLR